MAKIEYTLGQKLVISVDLVDIRNARKDAKNTPIGHTCSNDPLCFAAKRHLKYDSVTIQADRLTGYHDRDRLDYDIWEIGPHTRTVLAAWDYKRFMQPQKIQLRFYKSSSFEQKMEQMELDGIT